MLDYDALKQQFDDSTESDSPTTPSESLEALNFDDEQLPKAQGLTGSRLRSYAFAVLTRREYSKAELIEKLALYAMDRDEVLKLVDELATQNYLFLFLSRLQTFPYSFEAKLLGSSSQIS